MCPPQILGPTSHRECGENGMRNVVVAGDITEVHVPLLVILLQQVAHDRCRAGRVGLEALEAKIVRVLDKTGFGCSRNLKD